MSDYDKNNNELLCQMATALEAIAGWITGADAFTVRLPGAEPSAGELEYRAAALAHMETTQRQQDAIARSMAAIAAAVTRAEAHAEPPSAPQVGRYADLASLMPIYEFDPADDVGKWSQYDPLTGCWRVWDDDDGWNSYGASVEPSGASLCRAVPRGEADASPMSRGPVVL